MTKSSNLVLREDSDRVATLSLNRPQQGNSLSLDTIDALFDHLMALRQEKSIGVIVLRGVGKNIFVQGTICANFPPRTIRNSSRPFRRAAPA
jgi:enoyl-CoA hydratase/carnithine racemase